MKEASKRKTNYIKSLKIINTALFVSWVLILVLIAYFLEVSLDVKLLSSANYLFLCLVIINRAAICLFEGKYRDLFLNIFVVLGFAYIAYSNSPLFINNYRKYQKTKSEELSKCQQGEGHSCHSIASAAYNLGFKHIAAQYFSAACLLADQEACAEINEILRLDLKFEEVAYTKIAKNLCESGNTEGCVQEAVILVKNGQTEKGLPTLEQACSKSFANACVALGEHYQKLSILKARSYLEKACTLQPWDCWRLEYVCTKLSENWRWYEKNGELEETLRYCREDCKKGYIYACSNLGFYLSNVDSINKRLADKFKKSGDLVKAAEYYSKICSAKRTAFSCTDKQYICGNVSIGQFLETEPTEEQKTKTLVLCKNYCESGISTACGGVAAFYHEEGNPFEVLRYEYAECKLDLKSCGLGLEHTCLFRIKDIISKYPDKLTDVNNMCAGYKSS